MLDNDAYASPAPAGSKGEAAERALRSAIVHCVLAPGERLSEARLAQEFALGRGAVRAALARLQAAGFVSASARSGWSVSPISAGEIREVVSARRRLEPLLGSIALSDSDRARLERLADMHGALAQRVDPSGEVLPTIRRYERDLLDILAARLGMPVVAGWLGDLWDRSGRLVHFFEARGPARLATPDRPRLVKALIAGRGEEATDEIANAVTALESFLLARFLESEAAVGKPASRRTPLKRGLAAPAPRPAKNSTRTGKLDDA